MTAILLVCHQSLGQALFDTVESILGGSDATMTSIVGVLEDDRSQPEQLLQRLQAEIQRLLLTDQVLILTDLPGATPHNLAVRAATGHDVPVVSGVNLPMLLRCLNHAGLPADALAEKAVEGARAAIFRDRKNAT